MAMPAQPTPPRPSSDSRQSGGRTAVLVIVVIGAVVCGLFTLGAIATEVGPRGLTTGLLLAAIPVFPVVATFLWLDRYEAEPTGLLVFAFMWGAFVATFGAIIINTASVQAITAAGGDPTLAAIFVAPLTEESFKGLGLLVILLLQRREFDGVVDGIVYAGMVGVGFAAVENVLYFGRTVPDGGDATAVVFIMRGLVSPFAHPLFTAAFGVGLGIAVRTRRPLLRVLAPILGFVVAVFLHGAWNLSASSGLNGFVSGYLLLQLPVFLLFGLIAVLARRREGRLIANNLTVYGTTGWLTPSEIGMLASLSTRREALQWARTSGGRAGGQAMREFQALGGELAFLRERMNRGTATADAPAQELDMLNRMSGLRRVFTAHS